MSDRHLEICIVGAGPRGLSVVERLCANERASDDRRQIKVHVVDPVPPGPGSVWRAEQSRLLLMNTVSSQITVYTDDSVRIDGPIEPGPSLYEWAKSLAGSDEEAEYDAGTLAEAQELDPDSYPSRVFYGRYLDICFRRLLRGAPTNITFEMHGLRAVAIADAYGVPGGAQWVRLEDGTWLDHLHAVVLAQGHLQSRLTARESRTASLARIHNLAYLTPANPADLDLSSIEPGQNVLLRGLGLNFFDHMTLLTVGRGGSFERQDDGGLAYRRSGREPVMYAFSRRGVPYSARGQNEKGVSGRYSPRLLTIDRVAQLRTQAGDAGLEFGELLWPLIQREVESIYYGTLLESQGRGGQRAELEDRYLAQPAGADPAPLLDHFGIDPAERWDWERVTKPYGDRTFTDREDFRQWLLQHLADDFQEANTGNLSSPLKSALDALRDLRNEIRLAVDHSGLDGDSHRDDLDGWYTRMNAFLSIGPPASRIEEMITLIQDGLLVVTGPGTQVRVDVETAVPAFSLQSSLVSGPPVRAGVLIEARLPEPDLLRTEDPLLRNLLDTDQAQPYVIPSAGGTDYETGGLAVTERPARVVDASDRAHPRRFAYGVPTESVHWVTASGIRPGVDSVTLGDSDAIARAVLELPPVDDAPAQPPPTGSGLELTGVIV